MADKITYTWVKYAYELPTVFTKLYDAPTLNGGVIDSTGFNYMGFAYNLTSSLPSNRYTDYIWQHIGTKFNYTWVKYADDINGTNMSDTPDGKRYLGQAYNKEIEEASNDPDDYVWTLIAASDGLSPYIDTATGTWQLYDSALLTYVDTGVVALGYTPDITIGTGNKWFIDGKDTGIKASGSNGQTPHIGDNGNWFIGSTDTNVRAEGVQGAETVVSIGSNGNWYLNGKDSGKPSKGADASAPFIGADKYWYEWKDNAYIKTSVSAQGENAHSPKISSNGTWEFWSDESERYIDSGRNVTGDDGHSPYIGDNGCWYEWDNDLNKYTSTDIKSTGNDGSTPYIKNGNWWIGTEDLDVSASGLKAKVEIGTNGHWVIDGVDTNTSAHGNAPYIDLTTGYWYQWDTANNMYVQTTYSAIGHSPKVSDHGTWLFWSDESNAYVDSWESVQGDDGHSPYIGTDGYWYEWNTTKNAYIKTTVKAKGEDGKSLTVDESYGVSSDKSIEPTTWSDFQTAKENWNEVMPFLWNREKTTYGTDSPTTSAHVIAIWSVGITDFTESYLITNSMAKPDENDFTGEYCSDDLSDTFLAKLNSIYRWLWDKETTYYTDGSNVSTIHLLSVLGAKGENGSAYILDLDNEMASVACDSSGNITGRYPKCTATLKYGTDKVVNAQYSCTCEGCSATVGLTDGVISITAVSADMAEIKVSGKIYVSDVLTEVGSAVMTINKVKPGKDGKSTIYELLPTYSFIKVRNNKLRVPKSLACEVLQVSGDDTVILNNKNDNVLPTGYYMKSEKDSNGTLSDYTLNSSIPDSDYNSTEMSLTFYLYNDSNVMIDKETVPVIYDGSDGSSVDVDESYGVSQAENTEPDTWSDMTTAKTEWCEDYPYLWNKEIVSKDGTDTGTNTHVIAIWTKGVKDFTEEYLITNTVAKPSNSDFSSSNAYYSTTLSDDFLKKIDGTYRWLWNKETTIYTNDSTSYVIHLLSVQGNTGEAGSAYVLDLDNEMASVACDANGNVTGNMPSCKATLKFGSDTVSDAKYYMNTTTGCTATVALSTGVITITAVSADMAEIKIDGYAKPEAETDYKVVSSAIMSINKVKPGKNGEPATTYELMPSYSTLKISKAGIRTPETLSCEVLKTQGETATLLTSELPTGYYMKSEKDSLGTLDDYTINTAAKNSSNATISMTFYLYNDSGTMIDKETVPVVIDGSDGSGIVGDESYGVSNSASTEPTNWCGDMSVAKASWNASNIYLWNKETITSADKTPKTTTHIMAIWSKGVKDFTEEYLITDSVSKPSNASFTASNSYYSTELNNTFLNKVDGTNRWLWDKETTVYTDNSSTYVIHLLSVQGLTGEAGSAYVLDLDNEMASVACSNTGTVTGTLPSCTATLKFGADTVSDASYFCTTTGCTASIGRTTGVLSITALSANDAEITVTAHAIPDGETKYKLVGSAKMNITKVYAGPDGSPATLYELLPSATSVKINSEGTRSPSNVSCGVLKIQGATLTNLISTTLPTGYYMKTEKDSNGTIDSYTLGANSSYTSTAEHSITYYLYNNSNTLIDKETIPFVSDGSVSTNVKLLPVTETAVVTLDEKLALNLKYYVLRTAGTTTTNLASGYKILIMDSDGITTTHASSLSDSSISYSSGSYVTSYHTTHADKPTSFTVKLVKTTDTTTILDSRNIPVTYQAGAMFKVDASLGEIKSIAQNALGAASVAKQTADGFTQTVSAMKKTNLINFGNFAVSDLSKTNWRLTNITSTNAYGDTMASWSSAYQSSIGTYCKVVAKTGTPYSIDTSTNAAIVNGLTYTLQFIINISSGNSFLVKVDSDALTYSSGKVYEYTSQDKTYYDNTYTEKVTMSSNTFNLNSANWSKVVMLFTGNASKIGTIHINLYSTTGTYYISNVMLSTGTELPEYSNSSASAYSYIKQSVDSILIGVTSDDLYAAGINIKNGTVELTGKVTATNFMVLNAPTNITISDMSNCVMCITTYGNAKTIAGATEATGISSTNVNDSTPVFLIKLIVNNLTRFFVLNPLDLAKASGSYDSYSLYYLTYGIEDYVNDVVEPCTLYYNPTDYNTYKNSYTIGSSKIPLYDNYKPDQASLVTSNNDYILSKIINDIYAYIVIKKGSHYYNGGIVYKTTVYDGISNGVFNSLATRYINPTISAVSIDTYKHVNITKTVRVDESPVTLSSSKFICWALYDNPWAFTWVSGYDDVDESKAYLDNIINLENNASSYSTLADLLYKIAGDARAICNSGDGGYLYYLLVYTEYDSTNHETYLTDVYDGNNSAPSKQIFTNNIGTAKTGYISILFSSSDPGTGDEEELVNGGDEVNQVDLYVFNNVYYKTFS